LALSPQGVRKKSASLAEYVDWKFLLVRSADKADANRVEVRVSQTRVI